MSVYLLLILKKQFEYDQDLTKSNTLWLKYISVIIPSHSK